MASFLDRLTIENFGCIQKAELALTPLHALIGPNDSGKTTALHAARLALQATSGAFRHLGPDSWAPFDPRAALLRDGSCVTLAVGTTRYRLGLRPNSIEDELRLGGSSKPAFHHHRPIENISTALPTLRTGRVVRAKQSIGRLMAGELAIVPSDLAVSELPAGFYTAQPLIDAELRVLDFAVTRAPRLLRIDPDALRRPSDLLQKNETVFFRDDRGTGLAALLDALRDRGDSSYDEVAGRLRAKFPTVKLLQLDRSADGKQKSVAVKLHDGTAVPADLMSEGMLYFLAFLVAEKLEPATFLIEEPENGLHPARIAEVMSILREMSKTSQVILATHSPLVVNELAATEVTVLRRTAEHGTVSILLSDTVDFERRSQLYATGELWLNYANGVDESPLVNGGPRP